MEGIREGARLLDEALAESRAAFVRALRDGDAAAAAVVYADDATLLPPSAELVKGLDAITAFWSAGVEAGISDIKLEALELDYAGRLAYEIGRYALRVQPADGEPVLDRGRYVLVHSRRPDGTWRRVVEMFNPDAQEPRAGERPTDRWHGNGRRQEGP